MRYDERDDGELLELAQAGWAPAFAVLVHRRAPALLAAFADDPDPFERVTDVFVRAMRQLGEHDQVGDVGPWLFALAGRPAPREVPPVGEETLDPIWRHLAVLWPDGRHVHHRSRAIRRKVLTVVGAIALGVAVPTIVLGVPTSPADEGVESVRAQPLDEPTEEVEREDLPSFEFPDVGDATTETSPTDRPDDTETSPTTDPSPTAPLVPAPPPPPVTQPTAEPTAEPTTEPTAEPTTEPTPEPTTEPTTPPDGGGGDGGGGGADGGGDGESGTLSLIRGDDS